MNPIRITGQMTLDDGQTVPVEITIRLLTSPAVGGSADDRGVVAGELAAPEPAEPFDLDRPIELRDHPGRRIQMGMLARVQTEAARWKLIAARFPWLADAVPSLPRSLEEPDQMRIDLDRLAGADVTDDSGQVVVSRVAEVLGYPTGGSKWTYLKNLAAAYQAGLDGERKEDVA